MLNCWSRCFAQMFTFLRNTRESAFTCTWTPANPYSLCKINTFNTTTKNSPQLRNLNQQSRNTAGHEGVSLKQRVCVDMRPTQVCEAHKKKKMQCLTCANGLLWMAMMGRHWWKSVWITHTFFSILSTSTHSPSCWLRRLLPESDPH